MRVLFALPLCPLPADAGGKILTLQAIEAVADRHEVTLVVLEGPGQSDQTRELARYGRVISVPAPHRRTVAHRAAYRVGYLLASLGTRRPVHAFYGCPGPFAQAVRREARIWGADIVHYDFWYSAIGDAQGERPYRRILLEQDVEFMRRLREAEIASGVRRWWQNRLACMVSNAESRVLRAMDCVMTVTPEDANVASQAGARRVVVFPVAVPVEDRLPPPAEPEEMNILFVGSFVHTPNVDACRWFVSEVFPRIRKVHPDARVTIVGPDPPRIIRELEAADRGARVTGRVPDVAQYYHHGRVVVAPLRFGSGIKLKVLEALSFGRPVVTTSIGIEGIEATPGEHLLVQDTPEGFAEAVSVLLGHPEHARKMGLAGRALVEQRYSRQAARERILRIYEAEAEHGQVADMAG